MSNLEIYDRFTSALFRGEFDRIGEVVDLEGYEDNCPGLTPGWLHGFAAALENFGRVVAPAFSDVAVERLAVVEQGDRLVVHNHVRAVHTGPFLGHAPSGARVAYDATEVMRFAGGKLAARLTLMDLHGVLETIRRAAPPPFTFVNIFAVSSREAQVRLAQTIAANVRGPMGQAPGFVSAHVLRSADGTRVMNYVQWRTPDEFNAMRQLPAAQEGMATAAALATSMDPAVYELEFDSTVAER